MYPSASSGFSRNRVGLVMFALLFAAGLIAVFVATRPKPTVEDQIHTSFVQMQTAAKLGDMTGATDILSEDFKAGSLTRRKIRLLIFEERRDSSGNGYDIEYTDPQILTAGDENPDERLVVSQITVKSTENSGEILWSSGRTPLTLLMKKEEQRVWLLFTVPKWRIIGAPGVPSDLGGL